MPNLKIQKMELTSLILNVEDRIATIIINREKSLNALNKAVMNELDYLFASHLNTLDIYGVIIKGSGEKAFAAGADITEFMALDAKSGSELSAKGHRIFMQIENFNVPVIAVIHGYALGAGCELAMSCHMRIATHKAMFGQPEVNLGLIPGYAGTQRLPMLIGKSKAMEYTLTANMMDANEAHRLGLVNYVTEQGEGETKAKELLHKIGKKGPLAVKNAIAAINAHYHNTIDGSAMEIDIFGKSLASEECKEGVSAFLEKRKANFRS